MQEFKKGYIACHSIILIGKNKFYIQRTFLDSNLAPHASPSSTQNPLTFIKMTRPLVLITSTTVFLVTLRSLFHSLRCTGSNSDLWQMIVLLTLCVPASDSNEPPGIYYAVIITIGKTKGTVCAHARHSSCLLMPVGCTAPLLDKLYT